MTAKIKKANIGAEVADTSKLAPRNGHHLDATSAFVSTYVPVTCKFCIWVLLIPLLKLVLSFPVQALGPRQKLTGYYHTSWIAKDGLPGAVLSLAQTTDGYLWIGGQEGLFRFDGLVIERYTPQHGTLLHEGLQKTLTATPDGGLWIGYSQGGISFLKGGKITNFTERDGFPAGLARYIVLDSDGAVWAAVAGGLARFDGNHWQKIQMDWSYPAKSAFSVVVDQKGTVWVTSENRIFWLPRGGKHFQDAGLSTAAGVLLLAPDNEFWLTEPRSDSIVRLQMKAGKLSRSRTRIQASDWTPMFDHRGGLWIGSWGDGIMHIPSSRLLPRETTSRLSPGVETFTETEGLSDNRATRWLEDREGNIWIAANAGLDRLRHSSVSWFALQPGTHHFSLIPTANGEILAASSFGGMIRLPQETPLSDAPRNILLSYRAPDGAVWLSCDDGSGINFTGTLFEWKDRRFTKIVTPAGDRIHVIAMTADHAGTLWFSLYHFGVYKFRDGVWTHVDVIKNSPELAPRAAVTDSEGRIWLAFPERELVIEISDGGVENVFTDRNIAIGRIDLLSQSGGPVWAAGSLGIAFSLNDKFHTVVAGDGSTFAGAYSLVSTKFDGVWLTARQGIFHIPRSEVEHVVTDPSYRIQYELFDQRSDLSDPLQTIDDGGVVAAVQGTDGVLWFATRNGVARIDPQSISKNLLAPPVSIRSISADEKEYDSASSPSLPALVKNIRIDYTALSLTVPERARFRYKLDGWDTDWVDAGSRRQAFYTNLRHGTYRFHVIACNSDGVWNEEGAFLDFSIAPAYYQTNWFRGLCMAVFIGVLWAAYRLRIRQLRHQEKKLRDVIETMPTFAWTSLADGAVDFVNRRWHEYTGLSTEKTVGSGWEAAVHPEDLERHSDSWRASLASGQPFESELRYRRAVDGQYRWFVVRAVPLRDGRGKVIKWYGISTDIEDRKRAEQLQADLAHVNRVNTMGELTASLAHDIKQPIGAAVTNAEACARLLDRDKPDLLEAREAVLEMARDARHAAQIIDRVRSLYRKHSSHLDIVDVNEIIAEMALLLRGESHRYGVSLRKDLAEELPKITADRVQLQQVFMNLMLNGIEAMSENGGELIVKSQLREDGQLLISVTDKGVGLPPEKADQIFVAFFTTKPQGTGLGLAITRSIVESHGGRVWAAANAERGTTFHFTLPMRTVVSA
jgi:PAS domain S-box-containing protein